MTSSARLPRRLVRVALPALILAAAFLAGPAARAGGDDFEFGKKLAEARYFDYARKVFDGILADKDRSAEDKDEARYGIALLKKEEALAAAARADVPYKDLLALFDGAANDIRAFVDKNPDNRNASQARLDVGTVRLAFVQWAKELLEDPDEMARWGVDANQLSEDAKVAVDKALEYFKGLRPKPGERKPKDYEELAAYYYVISQYYRALVEPPCSPAAMSNLTNAGNDLEEYIMDHDGQLLAVYAQDIYGLVWWELAKCEDNPEKKYEYFNKAFEWFETCVYTDDQGPDYLRVITSGFYHIAQAGLDAGRFPERNFARDALEHVSEMLTRHPTAWRTENGLRALVEMSKLECARGNAAKAVEVAKDAAERAKKAGKPNLERLANRQLSIYVSGGCGGSVSGSIDAGVLERVADDLFVEGRYENAIRAYRSVIQATPTTQAGFIEHGWHAWERLAACYKRLGDRMGEALAYEPIHDAWVRGMIPYEKGKENDPNMVHAGDNRRAAQVAMKELADSTGSRILEDRYKDMRDGFLKDYPDHPSVSVGEYVAARDKWTQAMDQRSKNDSRWASSLADARKHFENVTKEEKSDKQDLAWVYLVRCDYEAKKYADAVKTANRAFASWESPAAKQLAEKFPTVRARRHDAKGQVTYWMAKSLLETGKSKEALAALDGWHDEYTELNSPYPELGFDLQVQASLDSGDIEGADRYYRTLLRSHPEYRRLGQITFLLADHYNAKRGEIENVLRDVTKNLNEVRIAKRQAEKEALRLGSLLADLQNRQRKNQAMIDYWNREEEKGTPERERQVSLGDVEAAKKENKELSEERIPGIKADQDQWVPKRDKATEDFDRLLAQKQALEQKLYDPLVKAANYYLEWDESLKRTEQRRSPDNVLVFAHLFWNAGRLRPDEVDNWEKARALYEDYLGFKTIAEKPMSDPEKRTAIGRLGDVYVNLAEHAKDADTRRELVTLAVDRLQSSLANRAADNAIVVGMLADEVLVLSWRDPDGARWRFPIPRPATVTDLRDSVRDLGKEGGPPLPLFENTMEEKDYQAALNKFRTELSSEDDARLKSYVGGTRSTFDPILYRELANYDPEFRLALAWAYSETGREEDVPKALNLVLSLLKPPLGVEEDTPEWWRAALIQMHVYMRSAERKLTSATNLADATAQLETAGRVFTGYAAIYPDLGETAQPGNRERWLALLEELNGLRRKAGLLPLDASVTQPPPSPSGSQPGGGQPAGEQPGGGQPEGEQPGGAPPGGDQPGSTPPGGPTGGDE